MAKYDPLQFGTFVILAILAFAEIITLFFPRFQGKEHRLAVVVVAVIALVYLAISLGIDSSSLPRL
jgi:hypothetical protein